MSNGLYSCKCHKCDNEYAIGAIKVRTPCLPVFCVNCGSSNVTYQHEESVLENTPCKDVPLLRPASGAALTATQVRAMQESMLNAGLYGGAKFRGVDIDMDKLETRVLSSMNNDLQDAAAYAIGVLKDVVK